MDDGAAREASTVSSAFSFCINVPFLLALRVGDFWRIHEHGHWYLAGSVKIPNSILTLCQREAQPGAIFPGSGLELADGRA